MRTVDISRLVGHSVSLYSAKPLLFAGVGALLLPISVFERELRVFFVGDAVSLLLGQIVFAALTVAAARAGAGEHTSIFQCYQLALGKVPTLIELAVRQFGAAILLGVTIIGLPLAIRILVRWFFGTQAVMLRDLSAKDAISRSCSLVDGRWWQITGILLLIAVISTSSAIVFGGVDAGYSIPWLIRSLVWALCLAPVIATFWTLLFLALEEETTPAMLPKPATTT